MDGCSRKAEYASSRWHYYVCSCEGGRVGEAEGGGGGGTGTHADNVAAKELGKTITTMRDTMSRGGSTGGSIASTDLTTLILHHAVIGGHGVRRFCKASAANNHTVIVQKVST